MDGKRPSSSFCPADWNSATNLVAVAVQPPSTSQQPQIPARSDILLFKPCLRSNRTVSPDTCSFQARLKVPPNIPSDPCVEWEWIKFSKRGSQLVTIDKQGKVILWSMENNCLNSWKVEYSTELNSKVIAVHWLEPDHKYHMDTLSTASSFLKRAPPSSGPKFMTSAWGLLLVTESRKLACINASQPSAPLIFTETLLPIPSSSGDNDMLVDNEEPVTIASASIICVEPTSLNTMSNVKVACGSSTGEVHELGVHVDFYEPNNNAVKCVSRSVISTSWKSSITFIRYTVPTRLVVQAGNTLGVLNCNNGAWALSSSRNDLTGLVFTGVFSRSIFQNTPTGSNNDIYAIAVVYKKPDGKYVLEYLSPSTLKPLTCFANYATETFRPLYIAPSLSPFASEFYTQAASDESLAGGVSAIQLPLSEATESISLLSSPLKFGFLAIIQTNGSLQLHYQPSKLLASNSKSAAVHEEQVEAIAKILFAAIIQGIDFSWEEVFAGLYGSEGYKPKDSKWVKKVLEEDVPKIVFALTQYHFQHYYSNTSHSVFSRMPLFTSSSLSVDGKLMNAALVLLSGPEGYRDNTKSMSQMLVIGQLLLMRFVDKFIGKFAKPIEALELIEKWTTEGIDKIPVNQLPEPVQIAPEHFFELGPYAQWLIEFLVFLIRYFYIVFSVRKPGMKRKTTGDQTQSEQSQPQQDTVDPTLLTRSTLLPFLLHAPLRTSLIHVCIIIKLYRQNLSQMFARHSRSLSAASKASSPTNPGASTGERAKWNADVTVLRYLDFVVKVKRIEFNGVVRFLKTVEDSIMKTNDGSLKTLFEKMDFAMFLGTPIQPCLSKLGATSDDASSILTLLGNVKTQLVTHLPSLFTPPSAPMNVAGKTPAPSMNAAMAMNSWASVLFAGDENWIWSMVGGGRRRDGSEMDIISLEHFPNGYLTVETLKELERYDEDDLSAIKKLVSKTCAKCRSRTRHYEDNSGVWKEYLANDAEWVKGSTFSKSCFGLNGGTNDAGVVASTYATCVCGGKWWRM